MLEGSLFTSAAEAREPRRSCEAIHWSEPRAWSVLTLRGPFQGVAHVEEEGPQQPRVWLGFAVIGSRPSQHAAVSPKFPAVGSRLQELRLLTALQANALFMRNKVPGNRILKGHIGHCTDTEPHLDPGPTCLRHGQPLQRRGVSILQNGMPERAPQLDGAAGGGAPC